MAGGVSYSGSARPRHGSPVHPTTVDAPLPTCPTNWPIRGTIATYKRRSVIFVPRMGLRASVARRAEVLADCCSSWTVLREETVTGVGYWLVSGRARAPLPDSRIKSGVSVFDCQGFSGGWGESSTHGVPRRAMACNCKSSFRITATNATLPGLPRFFNWL